MIGYFEKGFVFFLQGSNKSCTPCFDQSYAKCNFRIVIWFIRYFRSINNSVIDGNILPVRNNGSSAQQGQFQFVVQYAFLCPEKKVVVQIVLSPFMEKPVGKLIIIIGTS
jgi:hypothetical protein